MNETGKYINGINFGLDAMLYTYSIVFTDPDTGEHMSRSFMSKQFLRVTDLLVERYRNLYVQVDMFDNNEDDFCIVIRYEHLVELRLMSATKVKGYDWHPAFSELNDCLRDCNPSGAAIALYRYQPHMRLNTCKEWVDKYFPIIFPDEYNRYRQEVYRQGRGDNETETETETEGKVAQRYVKLLADEMKALSNTATWNES